MRSVYRALANLVALGVLIQMADIALAWFLTLHDVDNGQVFAGSDDWNIGHFLHSVVGVAVIPLLALILLIVSFFAGIDGGVKWAAIVFGVVLLQVVLAFVSFGVPAIGALHGLNAAAVAGLASMAARQASKPAAQPEPAAA